MPSHAMIVGSFDPITNGHLWMIDQGLKLFDKITIVIATNPKKSSLFAPFVRMSLIGESIHECLDVKKDRVYLDILDANSMAVTYAKDHGISHFIRGIRNTTDFEYEHQLNLINHKIDKTIETVFVIPPRELIEVSSSMVKNLVGLNGCYTIVKDYVPPPVLRMFNHK